MSGACDGSVSIGADLAPHFITLADAAIAGRLAIYVGAGIGRSAPTLMPDSHQLLLDAEPRIRIQLGLNILDEAGNQKTLESVADEAEQIGAVALSALKAILAADDRLRQRPPSCAHLGLALLVSDALITLFTVNWDTCIERAGAELGASIEPTRTAEDRRVRWRVALNKICGCATDPETLRVSTAEIAAPESWAGAELEQLTGAGEIVFIGVGTLPPAMAALISQAIAASPRNVHAVGPTLGEPWPTLLAGADEQRHIATANEFVDGLQRGIARRVLADWIVGVGIASTGNAERLAWPASVEVLTQSIAEMPAMPFLTWLKGGGGGVSAGNRVIDGTESRACMVALAGLAAGRTIEVQARGDKGVVRVDAAYVELGIWPGASGGDVVVAEEARTDRQRDRGLYPAIGAPIVHLVAGHTGPLPHSMLTDDLVGGLDPANVVDAGAGLTHQWIPVETYLQGTFKVSAWPT